MKKRILSIVMCIVMVLSLLPVNEARVMAAGSDPIPAPGGSFTDLRGIISSATTGSVIKLTGDYVAGSSEKYLEINNKEITLDLNGHVINRNLTNAEAILFGFVIYVTSTGKLTIIDSSPETENDLGALGKVKGGCITGGNNTSNGGGIYCQGGLIIKGGNIVGNKAGADGGGIFCKGSDCSLTMDGGNVISNVASENGGGIYMEGGDLSMSKVSVDGNTATTNGGGIQLVTTKSDINACVIKNNKAAYGGGIQIQGKSGSTTTYESVLDEDVVIENNEASKNGGGLNVNQHGVVRFYGKLSENTAGSQGGGVSLGEYGFFYAYGGSEISKNTASGTSGVGGAINVGYATSTAEICGESGKEILISENSAVYGGGIYSNGTMSTEYADIKNNTAQYGGGIYNNGTTSVKYAEIKKNTASYGGGIYVYSGSATLDGGCVSENVASMWKTSAKTEVTGAGGGIYIADGVLKVGESVLTAINGNKAGFGGGIYLKGTGAEAYLYDTEVKNNTGVIGGGVYHKGDVLSLSPANTQGVDIEGNEALWCDGGIAAYNGVSVSGAVVIDNNISGKDSSDKETNTPNLAIKAGKTVEVGTLDASANIKFEIVDGSAGATTVDHPCTGTLTEDYMKNNSGAELETFFMYDGPDTMKAAFT